MSATDRQSGAAAGCADILADRSPADRCSPGGPAANGQANLLAGGLKESLGQVATLAAIALSTSSASVVFAGTCSFRGMSSVPRIDGQQSLVEQSLCAGVIGSGNKLIIGDTRADRAASDNHLPGPVGMIAWAGVPVHDQDGQVAGVLWVADQVPRQWSARDVAVLETLGHLASGEVALRAALARSAGRAALAQTLEESLLPPRLADIPGLQVAARYAAGGAGTEVPADFCDVFPSAGGC
jgi:phosphoserine phosphatase RsbU/P